MLERRLERARDEIELERGRRRHDAAGDAARDRAGARVRGDRLLHRRPRRRDARARRGRRSARARAARSRCSSSRACRAALFGRDFVTPEDVKAVAVPALAHRLMLRPELWVRRVRPEDVVASALDTVPTPAPRGRDQTRDARRDGEARRLHGPRRARALPRSGAAPARARRGRCAVRARRRARPARRASPDRRRHATPDRERILEGERGRARARRQGLRADRAVRATPAASSSSSTDRTRSRSTATRCVTLRVRATRWGALPAGARVRPRVRPVPRRPLGDAARTSDPLKVYPRAEYLRTLVARSSTQVFAGNQVAREKGDGIEFADLRPFVPGDLARRVNWRASARRGELWVNEYHPERNSDVIIFLDTFVEARATARRRSTSPCARRRRSRAATCARRTASA